MLKFGKQEESSPKFGTAQDNITVEQVKEQQPNFTHRALTMAQVGAEWVVLVVPVDPKSMKTGTVEVVKEDGTRGGAEVRFKILAAEHVLRLSDHA